MTAPRRRGAACAALLLVGVLALGALAGPVAAATRPSQAAGGTVTIDGQVAHTLHVTASDLEKLPPVTLRLSFQTMHGPEAATYTGALLWTVLGQAGAYDAAGSPRSRVNIVLHIAGTDGYTAALALAEIDPAFAGKQVLLAYRRDGKELPDGVRLVVPGDRFGGRSVKDVAAITVR